MGWGPTMTGNFASVMLPVQRFGDFNFISDKPWVAITHGNCRTTRSVYWLTMKRKKFCYATHVSWKNKANTKYRREFYL